MAQVAARRGEMPTLLGNLTGGPSGPQGMANGPGGMSGGPPPREFFVTGSGGGGSHPQHSNFNFFICFLFSCHFLSNGILSSTEFHTHAFILF